MCVCVCIYNRSVVVIYIDIYRERERERGVCVQCVQYMFDCDCFVPAWQGVDCLLLLVDKCCFIVWHVIAPLGNIDHVGEKRGGGGYCYKTTTFAHSILPYSG